jgi:hypothetical protein
MKILDIMGLEIRMQGMKIITFISKPILLILLVYYMVQAPSLFYLSFNFPGFSRVYLSSRMI